MRVYVYFIYMYVSMYAYMSSSIRFFSTTGYRFRISKSRFTSKVYLYLCMYVCMYVCIYEFVYLCVCICIYLLYMSSVWCFSTTGNRFWISKADLLQRYMCLYIHIYTYIYVCMCVCMYINMYIYINLFYIW
jgi:hypothetical protein